MPDRETDLLELWWNPFLEMNSWQDSELSLDEII